MALVTVFGLTAALVSGTGQIVNGFEQTEKVIATSTAMGGHFGNAVDIFENVMIIGAPYQGLNGTFPSGPGYAQVSVFSDWDGSIAEIFDLSASDGQAGDLFGMRVAIGNITGDTSEGGVAYVAAPRRAGEGIPSYAGAVYLFSGEGESEITESMILTPFDGPAQRGFGISLDFDGEQLAVGAPIDSTNGVDKHGAAYVYTLGLDGLPTHAERVECDTPTANQYLGWAISIDGDRMAVGAVADSVVETQGGAVYIFDRQPDDSWTQTEIVTPVGLAYGDWFGTDVVLYDELLIASSFYYDVGEGEDLVQNVGCVYVFKWDGATFQQVQQILPPIIEMSMGWGFSIDFDGSHLVIGGNTWQNDGVYATGAAAAYEYGPDGLFINGRVFIGGDVTVSSRFGYAVALDGDRAVIGAVEDTDGTGGAAYVFSPHCGGDLDNDGVIDLDDILDVVEGWGNTGITTQDVVQDFEVGIFDLLTVLQYYGTCG